MTQTLFVEAIEAFEDNYIWSLRNKNSDTCVLIDPGDEDRAIEYLEKNNLKLDEIWNTHHHPDHTGANLRLKNQYNCRIRASRKDAVRIPGADVLYEGGDHFSYLGVTVQVIGTPGHTLGAISFFIPDLASLFCGDTLFLLGCGRMFEGHPEMFWTSLKRLRELPSNSLVYCAHEYTLSNSKFAKSLLPDDPDLGLYIDQIQDLRSRGESTVPGNLGQELLCNPFLLADQDKLRKALSHQGHDLSGYGPEEVFGLIRSLKDQF